MGVSRRSKTFSLKLVARISASVINQYTGFQGTTCGRSDLTVDQHRFLGKSLRLQN